MTNQSPSTKTSRSKPSLITVRVGDYEIMTGGALKRGTAYIRHKTGEGMGCKIQELEEAIAKFYSDNF